MTWVESALIGITAVVLALVLGLDWPIWVFFLCGFLTGATVAIVRLRTSE